MDDVKIRINDDYCSIPSPPIGSQSVSKYILCKHIFCKQLLRQYYNSFDIWCASFCSVFWHFVPFLITSKYLHWKLYRCTYICHILDESLIWRNHLKCYKNVLAAFNPSFFPFPWAHTILYILKRFTVYHQPR